MSYLPLVSAFAIVSTAAFSFGHPSRSNAGAPLCTRAPGSTLAVLRVERDTTLPFAPAHADAMTFSGVRAGPWDSLLATPTTRMPAARVRLLQLDSATSVILATHGVTDRQPVAFIRAEPYRADCRTVRWTDSTRFVERGEVGYVRGTLASREDWIDGVPLIVIHHASSYPYPRRRGLAFPAAPAAPLSPAAAMFSINAVLEMPRSLNVEERIRADSARRARALVWARANPVTAELEPVRSLIRRAVLDPDWREAERLPSRLRGTYRVDIDAGDARSRWFFRTHDRAGYSWRGRDSLQTTAELLTSPSISGYRLVGNAASSLDSLSKPSSRGVPRAPLVWLATDDRPTVRANDSRRTLSGILEFTMDAVPESLWDDLEPFVPRPSALDSAMRVGLKHPLAPGRRQPQLPVSVHFDERGGVRADTTLTVGGRRLRLVLERIDTLSVRRPF